MNAPAPASPAPATPAWGAVFSLSLGVFALVTAEFLPASLLTPMAASLGVTEGMAGQAVTATSAVAMVASLLISSATRRIDRRWVLLAFLVLLVVANLLVAYAPSLAVVLVGRVLLGVALGGFWAMSSATAMRLVPEAMVPRALSIMLSGVSLATIAAAPMGSYFGHLIGWRHVFELAAGVALLGLIFQLFTLPRMAPTGAAGLGTLVEVLRRPGMGRGMLACIFAFTGHFAFFTYLRPYLEGVAGVGVYGLSAILLGFGLANFVGTSLAGLLVERSLWLAQLVSPLLMVLAACGMVMAGRAPFADAGLVALWGIAFGIVPVAWSTWITRIVPDEAESGGGLLVATIQLAITIGAAGGGLVFDASGARGVFSASALVLLAASAMIFLGLRVRAALAAS